MLLNSQYVCCLFTLYWEATWWFQTIGSKIGDRGKRLRAWDKGKAQNWFTSLLLHCTLKTLMIFTAVKSILNFPAPFWTEDGFLENFGRENSKLKFPFKFCSLHHELLQTDLIFSFRRIWQWRSSIQFPLWFCQWLWKWPKATKPSTTSFWFASSYVVILLALSFPSD